MSRKFISTIFFLSILHISLCSLSEVEEKDKEIEQKEFDEGVQEMVGSFVNNMMANTILDQVPEGDVINAATGGELHDNPFSLFKHFQDITHSLFQGMEESMNEMDKHKKKHHKKHKGFLDLDDAPTISISIFKSSTNPDGSVSFTQESHNNFGNENEEEEQAPSVKIWENDENSSKDSPDQQSDESIELTDDSKDDQEDSEEKVIIEKKANSPPPSSNSEAKKRKIIGQSSSSSWINIGILIFALIIIGGYFLVSNYNDKNNKNGDFIPQNENDYSGLNNVSSGKKPFEIIKRD